MRVLTAALLFAGFLALCASAADAQEKKDKAKPKETPVAVGMNGNLFQSAHFTFAKGVETTLYSVLRRADGELEFKLQLPAATEKKYKDRLAANDKKLDAVLLAFNKAKVKFDDGGEKPADKKALDLMQKAVDVARAEREKIEDELQKESLKLDTLRSQAGLLNPADGVAYYALRTRNIQSGFRPHGDLPPGVKITKVTLMLNSGQIRELGSEGLGKVGEKADKERLDVELKADATGDYNPPNNGVTPEQWKAADKGNDRIILIELAVPGAKKK